MTGPIDDLVRALKQRFKVRMTKAMHNLHETTYTAERLQAAMATSIVNPMEETLKLMKLERRKVPKRNAATSE